MGEFLDVCASCVVREGNMTWEPKCYTFSFHNVKVHEQISISEFAELFTCHRETGLTRTAQIILMWKISRQNAVTAVFSFPAFSCPCTQTPTQQQEKIPSQSKLNCVR